ncbi:membrane frizzled-related protein [Oncorhynchus tshawytscha]|nr:membrane frizzled-related protein [Oncorhynchus tshawytscha]
MRLRGSWSSWGALAVSAAAVLLVAALVLALVLIFTQLKGQSVDGEVVSTNPLDLLTGDGLPRGLPTTPTNHSQRDRCGGVLTDSEGSFSSPNHPGSYPPDSLCVWVIRARPPSLVQIHVSSLTIEGPSPCLFDWLELQEEMEQPSVVTRFCGNVAPPTVNTNSSTVWVTFRSDGSIGGRGFTAQYHAITPEQKSCSREEFMCDHGRCVLPVSVCDGQPHCHDLSDEANCSHKHKECGGQKTGPYGYLATPNHPKPYPHQQLCTWRISVEESHVIRLSFLNFSLETQDVCEFDYVEVHDSADSGTGRVLGRYCGTSLPPELTSSGPQITVVFVADEGVADSGFNASYQAISRSESESPPIHRRPFLDPSLHASPPGSSCEPIEVEMCQGLSYNLTSFPNIWLSIADQREAATLLRQYMVRPHTWPVNTQPHRTIVLTELACFQPLRRLVCGMFMPHCSPQGGVLQPCRSVCSWAEQQCSQALDVFTFSWPFNCHLLPDSQDPMECSSP